MAKKTTKGPGYHHHGCKQCHARYSDACETPNESGVCSFCRIGMRWELLHENALPKDCCIETARLLEVTSKAGKAHAKKYSLSSGCTWYQCQLCKRCHPYDDPTKIRREGAIGVSGRQNDR